MGSGRLQNVCQNHTNRANYAHILGITMTLTLDFVRLHRSYGQIDHLYSYPASSDTAMSPGWPFRARTASIAGLLWCIRENLLSVHTCRLERSWCIYRGVAVEAFPYGLNMSISAFVSDHTELMDLMAAVTVHQPIRMVEL